MNCHGAGMMRYNKLLDLGLSEQQIKDNLIFTGGKVGDLMSVAMTRKDAREWFGTPPPDLSVIARVRGADWLYTYLRSYYRDPDSPTGWNNMVFERAVMPHVLWTHSGQQVQVERRFRTHEQAEAAGRQQKSAWKIEVLSPDQADKGGDRYVLKTIRTETPGSLSQIDYDILVRDLVNFLTWMAEPNQLARKQWGYVAILVLLALIVLSYLLYKEFWKDVR
jgi:ubiquinol-cytochrome c reductase cytochrome c1 subunit